RPCHRRPAPARRPSPAEAIPNGADEACRSPEKGPGGGCDGGVKREGGERHPPGNHPAWSRTIPGGKDTAGFLPRFSPVSPEPKNSPDYTSKYRGSKIFPARPGAGERERSFNPSFAHLQARNELLASRRVAGAGPRGPPRAECTEA